MKKLIAQVLNNQLLRYLIVGVINTAFGYGIFCILIFLSVPYKMAVLFSTILGVLFNFHTIGKLVFKNKRKSLIFKFILVYMAQYYINITLISITIKFGINIYLAGAISTLFCAMISFIFNKHLVFKLKIN